MDVRVAERAGRPGWLNRRTILGAVLFLVSLVGARLAVTASTATVAMWAITEDLPAGSVLTEDATRIERVHLPPSLQQSYLLASRPLDDLVIERPMKAGELVPIAWVSARAATIASRSVTVPVDPEHAVGGRIGPGDRIDILATMNSGDDRARTVTVVGEAEVVGIVTSGGLVMGERALVGITVNVSAEDAQRVAFAARTAEIDVVRVDFPSDIPAPGAVTRADL